MDLFWVFVSAFGGTGAMLAIAWFLFRRFVDLQVSRVIEDHKANLEQRSAALKTELSIYAHEQNVGLSRLDEQRSQAIQALYGLTTKWYELFLELTQPNEPRFPNPQAKLQRYYNLSTSLAKTAEDLSVKTRDTAIFFQQESYEVIYKCGSAAMDISCDYYDATFGKVDMSKEPNYDELFPMLEAERTKLREALQRDFRQLQQLLVHEFRVLMKAERQGRLTAARTPTRAEAARAGGAER